MASAKYHVLFAVSLRKKTQWQTMKRGQNHQHIPKTLEDAGEFRMFIYELTESKIFSVSILFVILLNTVILVIQTDEAFSVKAGRC